MPGCLTYWGWRNVADCWKDHLFGHFILMVCGSNQLCASLSSGYSCYELSFLWIIIVLVLTGVCAHGWCILWIILYCCMLMWLCYVGFFSILIVAVVVSVSCEGCFRVSSYTVRKVWLLSMFMYAFGTLPLIHSLHDPSHWELLDTGLICRCHFCRKLCVAFMTACFLVL